jgi:hypothetical protein
MTCGVLPADTSPIHRWRFDEGAGRGWACQSGIANDCKMDLS